MAGRHRGWVENLASGSWRACWRDRDGKRRSQTFRTKALAERHLVQVGSEIHTGAYTDPRSRQLLSDFALRWVGTAPLQPSTRYGYERTLTLHILPRFGKRLLDEITYSDVQAWHADLRENRSAATVDRINNVLRSCLNAALRDGHLRANPAAGHQFGRSPQIDLVVPTPAQVYAIDERMPREYQGMCVFAAYTGLRFSEQAALRVGAVDLDREVLHVRTAVTHAGGVRAEGAPKTNSSRRSVPLAPPALQIAKARCDGRAPEDLLFPSRNGTPLRGSNVSATFSRRAAGAGVPGLRWHDLRHAFGSWLSEGGTPVDQVMALLGHSQLSTVQRYLHSSQDARRNAVRRLPI